MEDLFRNYHQLIRAADECVNKQVVLPSLILIYSAIVGASWIEDDIPNKGFGTHIQNMG